VTPVLTMTSAACGCANMMLAQPHAAANQVQHPVIVEALDRCYVDKYFSRWHKDVVWSHWLPASYLTPTRRELSEKTNCDNNRTTMENIL
jgi:hypothetical protein